MGVPSPFGDRSRRVGSRSSAETCRPSAIAAETQPSADRQISNQFKRIMFRAASLAAKIGNLAGI
jgi:hypothetical protein